MKIEKIFFHFVDLIVKKYTEKRNKKEIKYPNFRNTYLNLYGQLENSVTDTIIDVFNDLEKKGEYFWEEKAFKEPKKFKNTYFIIRRPDYLAIKDKHLRNKK